MQKIPTLFVKNPQNLKLAIDEVHPLSKWINDPGVIATRKFDGTAAAIIDHRLFRRFDLKDGRILPAGAIPAMEKDEVTGHHTHWIPCDFQNNEDAYFFEGLANIEFAPDDTYELCGPKINNNNEGFGKHVLIRHGSVILKNVPTTFEGLREYLKPESNDIEGIVFHNLVTGEMCKVRKSDFGFKRKAKK